MGIAIESDRGEPTDIRVVMGASMPICLRSKKWINQPKNIKKRHCRVSKIGHVNRWCWIKNMRLPNSIPVFAPKQLAEPADGPMAPDLTVICMWFATWMLALYIPLPLLSAKNMQNSCSDVFSDIYICICMYFYMLWICLDDPSTITIQDDPTLTFSASCWAEACNSWCRLAYHSTYFNFSTTLSLTANTVMLCNYAIENHWVHPSISLLNPNGFNLLSGSEILLVPQRQVFTSEMSIYLDSAQAFEDGTVSLSDYPSKDYM